MSTSSSNTKSQSKKTKDIGRERDRFKGTASESGGSSQCDTPPLTEKDGGSSQGRYAGIGPDSLQCMADQAGMELTSEAISNLAEDVSYKLRQMISTIALHSGLMKKTTVDSWDVNTAFTLSDTSPVVGATPTQYAQFGEEKLCCPLEELINVSELALTQQTYVFASHPTLAVEWITDDKNLNTNISAGLHNYYTKVARAILNLRKKPKELAVEDLMTNTRIGPIFPNLFNLAVLVLNDDNLNALNVPAKKPLQSNVLDMVDALCSNPCSLDTNIQQQFQRLFPVMVSNILGNGSLSEKMVTILTKITRTWPSFITIGKSILFDYLSQGTKERLTAPMIKCVMALGRRALVECLGAHLAHLDQALHAPRRPARADLRPTILVVSSKTSAHEQVRDSAGAEDIRSVSAFPRISRPGAARAEKTRSRCPQAPASGPPGPASMEILEVSTCLLRSEPTTYLEDYVVTDYTLYEMLGDSILPRRTIFPKTGKARTDDQNSEKTSDEDIFTQRPLRRPKLRLIPTNAPLRNGHHRESVFEYTKLSEKCIRIKIRNCRTLQVPGRINHNRVQYTQYSHKGVLIAGGLLHRFKYKLNRSSEPMPLYGTFTL